jgi:hypothetical protein
MESFKNDYMPLSAEDYVEKDGVPLQKSRKVWILERWSLLILLILLVLLLACNAI